MTGCVCGYVRMFWKSYHWLGVVFRLCKSIGCTCDLESRGRSPFALQETVGWSHRNPKLSGSSEPFYEIKITGSSLLSRWPRTHFQESMYLLFYFFYWLLLSLHAKDVFWDAKLIKIYWARKGAFGDVCSCTTKWWIYYNFCNSSNLKYSKKHGGSGRPSELLIKFKGWIKSFGIRGIMGHPGGSVR